MNWIKKIFSNDKPTNETKSTHARDNNTGSMKYFEVNIAGNLCSDNKCPCSGNEKLMPGKTMYAYISKDVVDFRKDALTLDALEKKQNNIIQKTDATLTFWDQGTVFPILVCEQGARLRGLNLKVASADAEYGFRTGKFPLRPTPLDNNSVTKNSNETTYGLNQECGNPDFSCPDCMSLWQEHQLETDLFCPNCGGRLNEYKKVLNINCFITTNLKGKIMSKFQLKLAFGILLLTMLSTIAIAGSDVYLLYIHEDNISVRAEPNGSAKTIYRPSLLTVLEVFDHESYSDWLGVISPNDKRGWVLKSDVNFDPNIASDPSIAKKGVIDREVAKKEMLNMWQTRFKNANPVCDICNVRLQRNSGYLLTSKHILSSRNYHVMLKQKYLNNYDRAVEMFEQDRTPWAVCESCIDKYFVDIPGSSNPKMLAAARDADNEQMQKKLEVIKKKYTLDQVREKMKSGKIWLVEDGNAIYPIVPNTVDDWILETLEKEQVQN